MKGVERIVVTGASSGIGRALAIRLVAAGAHVLALDRARDLPEEVEPVPCDIADPASVAAAAEQIGGPLHGLANVAGVPGTAPASTVMAVNTVGLRALTEALLPAMTDGAAIVNVSSLAGRHAGFDDALPFLHGAGGAELLDWVSRTGLTGGQAYDLSKKLLLDYTVALAARLMPRGIRCCSVSPGPVQTPILDEFRRSMDGAVERAETYTKRHARPDEIAAVIAFLLSSDASWLNGIDLLADGGLVAARQNRET